MYSGRSWNYYLLSDQERHIEKRDIKKKKGILMCGVKHWFSQILFTLSFKWQKIQTKLTFFATRDFWSGCALWSQQSVSNAAIENPSEEHRGVNIEHATIAPSGMFAEKLHFLWWCGCRHALTINDTHTDAKTQKTHSQGKT